MTPVAPQGNPHLAAAKLELRGRTPPSTLAQPSKSTNTPRQGAPFHTLVQEANNGFFVSIESDFFGSDAAFCDMRIVANRGTCRKYQWQ